MNRQEESFSDRFKRARRWKYDSQSALAEDLGIKARQTVGDWETGKSFPDADKLAEFCQLTGAHPYWLLLGEGPRKMSESAEADYEEGRRALSEEVRSALRKVLPPSEDSDLPGDVL